MPGVVNPYYPERVPNRDREGVGASAFPSTTVMEFRWACWPTKGDEDAWRAHSCVPRSHSCERLSRSQFVFARVRTRHARVRAPRLQRVRCIRQSKL